MGDPQARQELVKRAQVNRQRMVLAKAFLLKSVNPRIFQPEALIDQFAKEQGYPKVQHIVLNETVDPEPYFAQAVGYLTCSIAASQALWDLIHLGYYMAYGDFKVIEPRQGWTTVIPGRGGSTGDWSLQELSYVLPTYVLRSSYWNIEKLESFTDPDLFILEVGVENADIEVVEALQDAVRCLRHELYRPAVTLLGKAMEGAWIEVGIALANVLPETAGSQSQKIEEKLKDENTGIAKKITIVRDLYRRTDLLDNTIKLAEVRPEEIDSVTVWSDVVRDARNAIHFGAKPAVANSYEKVSVLFLEGVKALKMLYRIKKASKKNN